jgi:hypothetical protein
VLPGDKRKSVDQRSAKSSAARNIIIQRSERGLFIVLGSEDSVVQRLEKNSAARRSQD